ncbi:MAG TPA: fructose 1,6-bisphosphatase [Candidatus Dormibacteraeota bacterium]|nr:fructose 1,6-bisphosphatase [Candidatus Dormibacteraeota bacterium]
MPCGIAKATPSRFDGPPRIVALGCQITSGRLVGLRDMFADPGFGRARQMVLELADHLRGPALIARSVLPRSRGGTGTIGSGRRRESGLGSGSRR